MKGLRTNILRTTNNTSITFQNQPDEGMASFRKGLTIIITRIAWSLFYPITSVQSRKCTVTRWRRWRSVYRRHGTIGQYCVFPTRAGLKLCTFKYDHMDLRHALLVTDAMYKKQKKSAVVGRRGFAASAFARRARLRARRNSSGRKRSRHKKASRYRARTPFRWGVLMDTCSSDKHRQWFFFHRP